MGRPNPWEFSLWLSVPGRGELIRTKWRLAPGGTRDAARAAAEQIFLHPDAFIACETDDEHYYIIPIDQILWVRVETRERQNG